MQFSSDSIALIQAGKKSVTRRPWKEGDELKNVGTPNGVGYYDMFEAVFRGGRRMWMIGQDYAISPGRGKFAVGRIPPITSLRLEMLGEITDEDAKAEGITYYQMEPHSFAYGNKIIEAPTPRAAYLVLWRSIYEHADSKEKVWAISFEKV